MSKTVGYVLTAALIVFAIAVPIIGPTTLAAWGLSAGTITAIGAGLSAAIMVNSLLMPKPKSSNNAQETTLQIGEVARRAIFGKSATAGSLVDAFNYGGKYGTDNEVVVFALCDHKVEELVGVYVNDVWVPWAGDGNYSQFDTHHLSMYFRDGSEVQTLPSVVTTHGPGWTSDDYGAGVCYAVVDYLADSPTAKHPAWPGGRPTFLWVVKGKKCYDPRLDTTVGGSGSHRWDDPSTWEWSENPIVCHYNYERGIFACDRVDQPAMLLVGRGLTATEVPPANIFGAANLCDEVMTDTLPRYSIGGVIAADEKYLDVAEKFAAACGGIIIQPEGSVEIEPGQARTPSFTITDNDVLSGSVVEYNQGILSKADSELLNTIIPRYVDPTQKWADQSAPVRRVDADVLADGASIEEDVVLQLVTVQRQASDIGEIHRKLGRLFGRGKVVLGPQFAEVEEGDWGTWISDRLGISQVLRVESYALDGKFQNALQLRQINSDVYNGVYGAGSSTGSTGSWDTDNPAPPIDIGTPDSGNWTLSAVTLTDASGITSPALEITGSNSDDPSAEAIIFEYWKYDGVINPVTNPDDPTWTQWGGAAPPTTVKVDIAPVIGGGVYYAAISYLVSSIRGDRLVRGPVTTGSTDISAAANPLIDTKLNALAWKNPVRAKTTAALAANTYANGTSGVGATLTGNSNGALAAQDGVTLVANDRLLVANESSGSHNGIYKVTQVGDGSHPYILTRTTDADEPAELVNATVKVSEGTAAADQEWQCTTNATITVGTTSLVWAQVGAATYASTTEQLTGTEAAKSSTPDSVSALWEQGADVASAGTISLGEGGYFNITGTTTITDIDFATDKAGRAARVKFAGILTLTHNASTLILPTGANIVTAAGDTATFVSEGSDVVRCTAYQRASGIPLTGSDAAYSSSWNGALVPPSQNAVYDKIETLGGTVGQFLLESRVLGGTSAGETFTIPGGYRDVKIVIRARGDAAGVSTVNVQMQINGDTGANYDDQRLQGTNTTTSAAANAAATSARIGSATGATAVANEASLNEVTIYEYAGTTFRKVSASRCVVKASDAASGVFVLDLGQWWRSTAAITSVKFFPISGNFIAGTTFTVYGLP